MNAILEGINSAGRAFVEFAGPMLVQSSVLIAILLAVDFLLRRKVRAVFRYWLWMLVLVKLVLPISLTTPVSLGYWFGEQLEYVQAEHTPAVVSEVAEPLAVEMVQEPKQLEGGAIEVSGERLTPLPVTVVEPVAAESGTGAVAITPVTWEGALFLGWLAGVTAMGLLLVQRAIFVMGLVAQAKGVNGLMGDTLKYCCGRMGVKGEIGLKVSANATSPAVCGLFRPVILVPQDLGSNLGAGGLRVVLMHELAHIRRGDLWVNLVQTILQIVYFYNPLLWVANAVIRRVREQAVDEAVQVAMGEKAVEYPETLVRVAKLAFERPALSLRLIGVVESKSTLQGRVRRMLERPLPKSAKLGFLGLIVILVAGAILLPMAKGMSEPPGLVIIGVVTDAESGQPIAGAKVFDDGYGPTPQWDKVKPNERSQWGAITNSAGEYSFLTWPEHHCIKVIAPGYKAKREILYDGHFTLNKKDEEIFDFTLEPVNQTEEPAEGAAKIFSFIGPLEFKDEINIKQQSTPAEFKQIHYRKEDGFWAISETGEHTEPATVYVNSISFKKTLFRRNVSANLKLSYSSWPKAEWQFTVGLLDDNGKSLREVSTQLDTGGMIISGQVLGVSSELDFSFGRWHDFSKSTTFQITIEPIQKTDVLAVYEVFGMVYDSVPDSWWEDYFDKLETAKSEDEFRQILEGVEDPRERPAAGIVVTLQGDSITRETITDTEGKYKFNGLRQGTYSLLCEKTVVSTRTGGARKAVAKGDTKFTPPLSARSHKVDLRLRDDQINIKGRITDTQGRPVGGAKVTAILSVNDIAYQQYLANHDPRKWFAVSEDDGSYVVEYIEPANFYRIAGYICSGRPYKYVDMRVEADDFVQNKNNIPKVTLISEEELYRARRFVVAANKLSERAGAEQPGLEEEEGLSLPAINGNTITGVDIVLERTGTAVEVEEDGINKQRQINSIVEAAFMRPEISSYAANLANGVTVELVGICEHPSEGKRWWRPDGSLLEEAPYDDDFGRAFPRYGEKGYKFAVKLSGMAYKDVEFKVIPAEFIQTQRDNVTKKNGKENTKYIEDWIDEKVVGIGASFVEEAESCDIEVGVCFGEWKDKYKYETDKPSDAVEWVRFENVSLLPNFDQYEGLSEKEQIVKYAESQARLLNHEYIGTEHILLGLVVKNTAAVSQTLKESGITGRQVYDEILRLVKRSNRVVFKKNLPVTPRAKLALKSANQLAKESNSVSVNSQHVLLGLLQVEDGVGAQVLMNLGLNLKKAQEAMTNQSGQEASEQKTNSFAAILQNGVTVELVGICEYPDQKRGWSVAGNEIKAVPWRLRDYDLETPENRQHYAFVAQISGSTAPSTHWHIQGGWETAYLHTVNDSSGNKLEGIEAFAAALPEDREKTVVGIGVATVPWETIATIKEKQGVSIGFCKGGEYTIQEPTDHPGGRSSDVKMVDTIDRSKYALRMVAMTNSGETITSAVNSTGGSYLTTTSHRYMLPLKQIKEFQLQTRPYEWVEFKNVSLKPEFKTDVQVEVEEPAVVFEGGDEILSKFFSYINSKIEQLAPDYPQLAEWDVKKTEAQWWRHGKMVTTKKLVYNHALSPSKSSNYRDWYGQNGCHIRISVFTEEEWNRLEGPGVKTEIFGLRMGQFFVAATVITENPEVPELEQKINDIIRSAVINTKRNPAIQVEGEKVPPPGRYALSFDGVDDYLEIDASESLQLGRHFTVQMWVKPEFPETSIPDKDRNLLSKGGYVLGSPDEKDNRKAKPYGFGFKLRPEGESRVIFDVCNASHQGIHSREVILAKPSDWFDLAVVFDGEKGRINRGVLFGISEETYELAPKSNIIIGGEFLILPTGNYFKGQIGELRIWNRAMSFDEIAEFKTIALSGNEPNLMGCWTFEQVDGQHAIDISPYKNKARLGSNFGVDNSDPTWVRIGSEKENAKNPDAEVESGVDEVIQASELGAGAVSTEKSLQELIDAAKRGGTVIVPEGVYTEPVRINKSLKLKGQSLRGSVFEVTANEPAIFIDTKGKGKVSIEGVTIKWQLATSDKGIEHPFAAAVKDTKAEIKSCNFVPLGNPKRSPVAIRAMGFSNLNIEACRFEGFEYVVCYGEGSEGVMSDSLIMECGHQGVILYSGAKAKILRNVITGSRYHAVRSTGGTLDVRDNLLINNANRGIYLGNKSARGVVANNIIMGNGTGISGFARSKVRIQNNIIADSSYAGISMRDSCSLSIRNNILQGNAKGCILHKEGSKNANKVFRNLFWENEVDVENFNKPAVSISAEPGFADPENGDFSLKVGAALEHKQGLSDPNVFKVLWKRWKNRDDKNEPFNVPDTKTDADIEAKEP